ncbi:MAG TPA: proton-conducting transporter membrane subunit, partial [Planctomycetota bacterium]|nr:proton-conducting transporter membrane subunit [Planctomycetota bacterium]
LCAGSIYVSTHQTEISRMSGLARHMPWTMGAFALASLSIVGIPLTSGFVSKWNLALGTVDGHSLVYLGVLLAGSLLSAAYLGPIVYKAYFEKEPTLPSGASPVREIPWMVVPLTITAAASLVLGLFPGPVLELAKGAVP